MSLRFLRETPLFRGALTPEWPAAGDFYWRIVRTGDFDESEELDILWRHDAVLGWNFIWLMNGASILGVPERPRVKDAYWLIVNHTKPCANDFDLHAGFQQMDCWAMPMQRRRNNPPTAWKAKLRISFRPHHVPGRMFLMAGLAWLESPPANSETSFDCRSPLSYIL
jgi:hypothetical protein